MKKFQKCEKNCIISSETLSFETFAVEIGLKCSEILDFVCYLWPSHALMVFAIDDKFLVHIKTFYVDLCATSKSFISPIQFAPPGTFS